LRLHAKRSPKDFSYAVTAKEVFRELTEFMSSGI